jgi:hypothetical protein
LAPATKTLLVNEAVSGWLGSHEREGWSPQATNYPPSQPVRHLTPVCVLSYRDNSAFCGGKVRDLDTCSDLITSSSFSVNSRWAAGILAWPSQRHCIRVSLAATPPRIRRNTAQQGHRSQGSCGSNVCSQPHHPSSSIWT